jgi:hypothetical protein
MSLPKRPQIRRPEKDRFGEVFTPPALINAMLDKLPPEVWTDPAKKWLDPAAGFGNFFTEVYPRLMKSLEDVISNPSERRRHILTQMLYMVEYNPESCARIRENPMFFENDDKGIRVGVNLICGSFLDPEIGTTAFDPRDGPVHFDIIVGNPPFNADQTHEGKKGGGANLWPRFVDKSLRSDLLKPDGLLLFVHPALWRKPPSPQAPTQFELMTHENHMLYLEIHSKLEGLAVFGARTRYDFYVIQKRKPIPGVSTTFILTQGGQAYAAFDLSRWHFLPNHSYDVIGPLLRSPDDTTKPNVIFSRSKYGTDSPWVHEVQRTPEDIPLIHSTPKGGPRILWSDPVECEGLENLKQDCVPMVGVPKVIFGESGINKVIIDLEGRYGLTQGAIGLRIPGVNPDEQKAEAEQMAAALESDIFNDILNAMSFSNFRIDWRIFLYLQPDFYKHPMFSNVKPHISPPKKSKHDAISRAGKKRYYSSKCKTRRRKNIRNKK